MDHQKIDIWLLAVIVAAAVSRALISPGTFVERSATALASILWAYVMTPAVVELINGYSGVQLSANLSGAVGASLAIAAEPLIRHIYAVAAHPERIPMIVEKVGVLVKNALFGILRK